MLNIKNLDEKQVGNLCAIINCFGTGDHPWADKNSVSFFAQDYAIECLEKALTSCKDKDNEKVEMVVGILKEVRDES